MPERLADDDVVIRFGPWSASGLKSNATRTHTWDEEHQVTPPKWGVSVFSGDRRPNETLEQAGARLHEALRHVDGAPKGSRISVTTVGRLINDYSYALLLDEPPVGHFLIGEGDMAAEPNYDRLSQALAETSVKNLKTEGGSGHD